MVGTTTVLVTGVVTPFGVIVGENPAKVTVTFVPKYRPEGGDGGVPDPATKLGTVGEFVAKATEFVPRAKTW